MCRFQTSLYIGHTAIQAFQNIDWTNIRTVYICIQAILLLAQARFFDFLKILNWCDMQQYVCKFEFSSWVFRFKLHDKHFYIVSHVILQLVYWRKAVAKYPIVESDMSLIFSIACVNCFLKTGNTNEIIAETPLSSGVLSIYMYTTESFSFDQLWTSENLRRFNWFGTTSSAKPLKTLMNFSVWYVLISPSEKKIMFSLFHFQKWDFLCYSDFQFYERLLNQLCSCIH